MQTLTKEPNLRGEGRSLVYETSDPAWTLGKAPRAIVKSQHRYICRPWWNLGRATPLVRRELRALRALDRLGVNVPAVIDYREEGEWSHLVTEMIPDSLDLSQALADGAWRPMDVAVAAAREVRRMHDAGWTHGALYPHHILFSRSDGAPPRATLIDLEKARRSRDSAQDISRFWRHSSFPDAETAYCFEQAYAS